MNRPSAQTPDSTEEPLRGRALRFVLVNELATTSSLTVAEMVQIVRRSGFSLGGRESKIISDALRWEVARGRVVKLARGVYRYGVIPPSTARRIKVFAAAAQRWIVAPTRTKPPSDTRSGAAIRYGMHQIGAEPPWPNLNWLWTT